MLEARPPVVSSIMGVYPPDFVRELKARGIAWFAVATTVAEAREAEAAGADAIIAQGMEAGGHRGCFDADAALTRQVGLFALLPAVADAVRIPVIAAGGIADARGVAAAQALGASAVTVGTAFLLVDECPLSPAYRAALRAATDADSTLTRAFSGRLARGVANRVTRELEGVALPAFPQPNAASRPMRQAAAKAGDADFLSLWAGQALPLNRAPGTAAQLVASLAKGWRA